MCMNMCMCMYMYELEADRYLFHFITWGLLRGQEAGVTGRAFSKWWTVGSVDLKTTLVQLSIRRKPAAAG